MEYLRRGKGIIDSALVRFGEARAELNMPDFKESEYYGSKVKVKLVDQLANPDPDFVRGYYQRIDDIKAAERFGTDNLDEYSHWAWRACGVANLMTILKSFGKYEGKLFDLVQELENKGGYLYKDKWGREDIGWKHTALRDALVSRGLRAEINTRIGVVSLLKQIAKEKLALASVKSRGNLGSHMVIVSGFQWEGKESEFIVDDPYNLDKQGGHKKMSLEEFSRIFLYKGISIWREVE